MRVLLLLLAAIAANAQTSPQFLQPSCQRLLYCNSKVLHYVQLAQIFPDSKTFVDLHLKYDENTIFEEFNKLLKKTENKPTKKQLIEFVNSHFDSTNELEDWTPDDFNPEPDFLKFISDDELKQFAKDINNLWPSLGRKVKPEVFVKPEHSSLFPVSHGFIIPGGKFKELYYWDSYWIIQGLLVSGMKDTVKGIISDLIEMQRTFGHVPNGARWYYQERSQPPLLPAMMSMYLQATDDFDFLKANIGALEDELEYWLDTHNVAFRIDDTEYSLLRYFSPSEGPRPEAYYEDFSDAEVFDTEERRDQFFVDIKSAAESGWDFSTRWFINQNATNKGNLSSIHVTDIVPVDLNAIFATALQNVAAFHTVLGDSRKGAHWSYLAKQWKTGIQEVLWDDEDGIWYDFDLSNGRRRKYFYLSNIAPLWMSALEPEFKRSKAEQIMEYLNKSHTFDHPGGIPTSFFHSGEQWDFPNAYPPLMSMTVSALESLQTLDAVKMAFQVAQNWVRSALKGYSENMQIYKKYNVQVSGKTGSLDDHMPKTGYGWSNGVILEMLGKYGPTLRAHDTTPLEEPEPELDTDYISSGPELISIYFK